jgi:hypothetical protein
VAGHDDHAEQMGVANGLATLDGAVRVVEPPKVHASVHQNGGDDEVATATPAADAIPKALATGYLAAGWISPGSIYYDIGVPTQNNNTAYFEQGQTAYATAVVLHYEGSGGLTARTPDKYKVVVAGAATGTIDVRLYDLTNGTTIAEALAVAVTAVPSIVDVGTVANVPTAEAIFEVQVAKGSSKGRIYFAHLYRAPA